MPHSTTEIKNLADGMFSNELAAEILKEANSDQMAAEAELGELGGVGIGTFFAGDRLFEKTGVGKFEGLAHVTWNGLLPDNKTPRFVYQPDNQTPFTFTTSSGRKITPGLMDTDGGSIPRVLHGIAKFSPWGYAPGYIIHDWIFTAHKCRHEPDDDITFEDSATILAECIKTMMEVGFEDFDGQTVKFKKAEDTMYLIYKAVASSIALRLWNDNSSTICR